MTVGRADFVVATPCSAKGEHVVSSFYFSLLSAVNATFQSVKVWAALLCPSLSVTLRAGSSVASQPPRITNRKSPLKGALREQYTWELCGPLVKNYRIAAGAFSACYHNNKFFFFCNTPDGTFYYRRGNTFLRGHSRNQPLMMSQGTQHAGDRTASWFFIYLSLEAIQANTEAITEG